MLKFVSSVIIFLQLTIITFSEMLIVTNTSLRYYAVHRIVSVVLIPKLNKHPIFWKLSYYTVRNFTFRQ